METDLAGTGDREQRETSTVRPDRKGVLGTKKFRKARTRRGLPEKKVGKRNQPDAEKPS